MALRRDAVQRARGLLLREGRERAGIVLGQGNSRRVSLKIDSRWCRILRQIVGPGIAPADVRRREHADAVAVEMAVIITGASTGTRIFQTVVSISVSPAISHRDCPSGSHKAKSVIVTMGVHVVEIDVGRIGSAVNEKTVREGAGRNHPIRVNIRDRDVVGGATDPQAVGVIVAEFQVLNFNPGFSVDVYELSIRHQHCGDRTVVAGRITDRVDVEDIGREIEIVRRHTGCLGRVLEPPNAALKQDVVERCGRNRGLPDVPCVERPVCSR